MKTVQAIGLGLAWVALAALAGCYAETTPDAVYVDAPAPAIDVSTYPQEQYDGQTVYYVNNHWYARRGDRWAYYRSEPAELQRRRTRVAPAPPAPERRVEHAPPPREPEREHEHEHQGEAPHAQRVE